jgi:uncharacterized membrane protein YkvA (DUF1232 family)
MWKLAGLWFSFKKEILMVWAMLRSPAAPLSSKVIAVLALLYIVLPVDLVPDFIPVLGWIDDGVMTYILIKLAFKFLPTELHESLKRKVNGTPPVSPTADVKR